MIFGRRKRIMADTYEAAETDEAYRQKLTPEQYEVTRRAGTERAFTGAYWDCTTPARTGVCAATRRCSTPTRSSTRAPAGPASGNRPRAPVSRSSATVVTAWCAPKCAARTV